MKTENKQKVNEIFKIPREYVKSVAKGFHNAFVFLGKQGLGKTTISLQTLKELKCKYVYHMGVSTPLALYNFLYKHRDNETIVFDDCTGLINNPNALSILLSALWGNDNDKRIVSWNTTKDNLQIPTEFDFNSKIIIIANKMPDTYYAQVVLSRCLCFEIEMTYHKILELMYLIGDKEIVDYIAKNSSPATKNFDLRLLKKAEKFKEFDKDNWKFLISPMLDVDEHIQLLIQCVNDNSYIENAVSEWCDKTNLSRATFFRKKALLDDTDFGLGKKEKKEVVNEELSKAETTYY